MLLTWEDVERPVTDTRHSGDSLPISKFLTALLKSSAARELKQRRQQRQQKRHLIKGAFCDHLVDELD